MTPIAVGKVLMPSDDQWCVSDGMCKTHILQPQAQGVPRSDLRSDGCDVVAAVCARIADREQRRDHYPNGRVLVLTQIAVDGGSVGVNLDEQR
jgi:hypothetical protein